MLEQTHQSQTSALRFEQLTLNLSELYANHHHWLVKLLNRKLSCPHSAADIAQDTFVKLLNQPDITHIEEPRAYLTTIAQRLLVNHFKRRAIENAYLEALSHSPESSSPSPETLSIAIETLVNIHNMLEDLPEKVRLAFLLCQLEGLSHAEIAERLSVSISSVRKYITHALLHCLSFKS